MTSTLLADLSGNNDHFDPIAYRAGGHVIVALKASEGIGFADPRHRGWTLDAHRHHIAVIHYHFGRPDNHPGPDGGAAEADWFLHCCNGLLGPHDYVVYDGERASNGAFGLEPGHCQGFDQEIQKRTRFASILYASASQLSKGRDALVGADRRDWCADYSSGPDTRAPGHRTVIRQFTDGVLGPGPHDLPGVGRCDVNIMRGNFARDVLRNSR